MTGNFKIPKTDHIKKNIKLLKDTLRGPKIRKAFVAVCTVFVLSGCSDARDIAEEGPTKIVRSCRVWRSEVSRQATLAVCTCCERLLPLHPAQKPDLPTHLPLALAVVCAGHRGSEGHSPLLLSLATEEPA